MFEASVQKILDILTASLGEGASFLEMRSTPLPNTVDCFFEKDNFERVMVTLVVQKNEVEMRYPIDKAHSDKEMEQLLSEFEYNMEQAFFRNMKTKMEKTGTHYTIKVFL